VQLHPGVESIGFQEGWVGLDGWLYMARQSPVPVLNQARSYILYIFWLSKY